MDCSLFRLSLQCHNVSLSSDQQVVKTMWSLHKVYFFVHTRRKIQYSRLLEFWNRKFEKSVLRGK